MDNNNSSQNSNRTVSTDQQDPNPPQEGYNKQRNQQMYSSLKIMDGQIQKYENASRSSLDTWKKDNQNKTLVVEDRVKLQNDNLKSI